MPSIRVKSGYATLDHPLNPEPTPVRPRARSVSTLLTRNAAPVSQPAHIPDTSSRPRAATDADRRPALISRPPSKVSDYIMGVRAKPSLSLARHDHHGYQLADIHHTFSHSSSQDRSDLLSLTRPTAGGLTANDEYEPGRVEGVLGQRGDGDDYDTYDDGEHHHEIVEHLDVIDPQVATVSMLTNCANSIVFPPLDWYSRKPCIMLPERRHRTIDDVEGSIKQEDQLDLHVKDVLTKRARFRRVMAGIWSFIQTPLGFIVFLYGFNIVFWGTGIVLFLGKLINVHNDNTQGFWLELCQQIETGLFTATSIGLIPFRAMDTYRIVKIWRYKRKTTNLRRNAGLPELFDQDDLPDMRYDPNYVHVLTDEQEIDLWYQQHQFMQSSTWYRPHGTATHRAFPINIALRICILNDLNSFFQCLLSGCMWSLDRFKRPAWTTATTLPASFVAGIAAGFYIWYGGKLTKRTEEVERRLRAALEMDPPHDATDGTAHDLSSAVQSWAGAPKMDGIPEEGFAPQSKEFTPRSENSTLRSNIGGPKATDFTTRPASFVVSPDELIPPVILELEKRQEMTNVTPVQIVEEMTVPTADAVSHSEKRWL